MKIMYNEDEVKQVLKSIQIPLLRFKTNGSDEEKRIVEMLERLME